MAIAKTLQKLGPDNDWRLRYEPIKQKAWRRTKHQVILRWKDDGTSKSWSFKLSEATDSDAEFQTRMLAAFDACLRNQKLGARDWAWGSFLSDIVAEVTAVIARIGRIVGASGV